METMKKAFFLFLLFSSSFYGSRSSQDFNQAAGARTLNQEVPHNHEVHCSRERSRTAWKIIEEYLMPFVDQEQYKLSSKCQLHPDNDIYREQEEHKIHVDINEWHCGFCKKSFRAEKFLDQHFDNRHYNLLNNTQGRCLADLCGALHCDLMIESKKTKKCNPAAVARNRHLCESLANSCFPVNQGRSASHLHEFFQLQFCEAHTCNGRQKPFSRGGKGEIYAVCLKFMHSTVKCPLYKHLKQSSVFYLAISVLTLMLLPIFYLIVFLHQREMKKGIQDLKRISKTECKSKGS